MDYNILPDIIILGGFVITLIAVITIGSRKPGARYHMIDQSKRWGK